MKSILTCFFVLFTILLKAQGGITATTDNKDVRFFLLLEGQQMNDFWETNVEVKGLKPGYYMVKFVFEGDSIADAWRNVLVKPNKMRTVKALPKNQNQKTSGKTGRKIGKSLKIGEHDENMDYLRDEYKLIIKSDATCSGCKLSEVAVSIDNSLSSSATPATKEKH